MASRPCLAHNISLTLRTIISWRTGPASVLGGRVAVISGRTDHAGFSQIAPQTGYVQRLVSNVAGKGISRFRRTIERINAQKGSGRIFGTEIT